MGRLKTISMSEKRQLLFGKHLETYETNETNYIKIFVKFSEEPGFFEVFLTKMDCRILKEYADAVFGLSEDKLKEKDE